jgi:hypothetical protein
LRQPKRLAHAINDVGADQKLTHRWSNTGAVGVSPAVLTGALDELMAANSNRSTSPSMSIPGC